MINSASKDQPFVPRAGEITARHVVGGTPSGIRSVFPGWGPKV
jgi:hypothetical protein